MLFINRQILKPVQYFYSVSPTLCGKLQKFLTVWCFKKWIGDEDLEGYEMSISPITVPTTVRRVFQLLPSKTECILQSLELKFMKILDIIIHSLLLLINKATNHSFKRLIINEATNSFSLHLILSQQNLIKFEIDNFSKNLHDGSVIWPHISHFFNTHIWASSKKFQPEKLYCVIDGQRYYQKKAKIYLSV